MSQTEELRWDMERDGFSTLPYHVVQPLRWEPHEEDGWLRLDLPHRDGSKKVQGHWAPVLRAIDDGAQLPEIYERSKEAMSHRPTHELRLIVFKVVGRLESWGLAEIETPPVDPVLGKRYEVIEQLGRGGMGVVWRCRDLKAPDRGEVAVKHAWNWRSTFERREKSLRREAERMKAFQHGSIVSFYETFEHDGRLHLARELVEGPSLRAIARDEPGAKARAQRLHQIAESLGYIRDQGYLLLDVKTSNYRLDEQEDRVKLMDLGVCRPIKDGTVRVRGFPGTRRYQDPYVMTTRAIDERTVVYAVGRILYEFVTGDRPTPRGHYESYFEQHPLDLNALGAAGATEAELALYEDACSPDPDDRPPTLEAFSERLG